MSDGKNQFPIDPKDLVPAVGGFFVGLGIITFFVILAIGMGMTLYVDKTAIPFQ